MCKILECFVRKFIIIILFIPSFFFLKKYYLSFNIDFDIKHCFEYSRRKHLKNTKKKKNANAGKFLGRNHFLNKKKGKKQSFCFQNSVFSVSHFPPFGCARFAHQMNLLSLESYILFLYPWLKFGMWLFQFPPHLKKKSSGLSKKKNGKKPAKIMTINRKKKHRLKKNHGSKNAIFFVCYFLEYCAKTVAKIVENKMAVFLWRKKNRKEKNWRKIPPTKNGCPFLLPDRAQTNKNDNCAFLKNLLCYFVVYYQFYPLLTINFRLESSERCSNGWILSALKNGVQNSIPKKSIKDFKKKIYKKKIKRFPFLLKQRKNKCQPKI